MPIDLNNYYPYIILSGVDLDPTVFHEGNYLIYSENRKGELGTSGRYKGKPQPQGSCMLKPMVDNGKQENILELAIAFEDKYNSIDSSLVERIIFNVSIKTTDMYLFDFEEALVNTLSRLKIGMGIEFYQ